MILPMALLLPCAPPSGELFPSAASEREGLLRLVERLHATPEGALALDMVQRVRLKPARLDVVYEWGDDGLQRLLGTVLPPAGIDWLCVSPKAGSELLVKQGQELKLVFPQAAADPAQFASLKFEHFYLQPMDGPAARANTQAAIAYAQSHPQWRLSVQTHKLIGIR